MFNDEPEMAFGWSGGPRRGPWGFGPGPQGPWGEFGPGPRFGRGFWGMFGPGPRGGGPRGGRGPQMFGRGDLKFVLLGLLAERPRHGYEMIKELEDRAGGFYSPSAGAIYPTLQLMEDRGWVTSATIDGKKVYTITDAGRSALNEQGERPFGFGGPHHGHHDEPHHGHGPRHGARPFFMDAPPELGDLGRESVETAMLLRDAVMSSAGDSARLARLREIISQTRTALRSFLEQPPNATPDGPQPQGPVKEV